jgi:hypothetical protein
VYQVGGGGILEDESQRRSVCFQSPAKSQHCTGGIWVRSNEDIPNSLHLSLVTRASEGSPLSFKRGHTFRAIQLEPC